MPLQARSREGGNQVRPCDDPDHPAPLQHGHGIDVAISHLRQEHRNRGRWNRRCPGNAHDVQGTNRLHAVPVEQAPERRELCIIRRLSSWTPQGWRPGTLWKKGRPRYTRPQSNREEEGSHGLGHVVAFTNHAIGSRAGKRRLGATQSQSEAVAERGISATPKASCRGRKVCPSVSG